MTDYLPELLRSFIFGVFNEHDPVARRAAIERCFAANVFFADHDGVVTGWDGIDAKVEELQARAPEFVFAHITPAQQISDLGYAEWGFGPPGGAPAVTGRDIVFGDGERITRLYVVVTSRP